jgi:hypothetical protein
MLFAQVQAFLPQAPQGYSIGVALVLAIWAYISLVL